MCCHRCKLIISEKISVRGRGRKREVAMLHLVARPSGDPRGSQLNHIMEGGEAGLENVSWQLYCMEKAVL